MKADLSLTCISHRGPVIWKGILTNIDRNSSFHLRRALKQCIFNKLLLMKNTHERDDIVAYVKNTISLQAYMHPASFSY